MPRHQSSAFLWQTSPTPSSCKFVFLFVYIIRIPFSNLLKWGTAYLLEGIQLENLKCYKMKSPSEACRVKWTHKVNKILPMCITSLDIEQLAIKSCLSVFITMTTTSKQIHPNIYLFLWCRVLLTLLNSVMDEFRCGTSNFTLSNISTKNGNVNNNCPFTCTVQGF